MIIRYSGGINMYILGILCGILLIIGVLFLIGKLIGFCIRLLPAILTTGFVAVAILAVLSCVEVQNLVQSVMSLLS